MQKSKHNQKNFKKATYFETIEISLKKHFKI